ncbi:MAG: NCS1 family nucleobase:cation symporter-1 [Treponemataceae bacterium]
MNIFQKDSQGLYDLTDEGVSRIYQYENNYTDTTKQVLSNARDWNAWSMGSLWIGIMVSIAVYMIASGLIVSGMSWKQALFTIVLGHTLVMIPAVLIGHFGTKYGLTYPMMSKLVFGIKGSCIPTFIRAFLGCFWFGVQSWIGGQAVNTIISVIIPVWNNYGFTTLFISFLLFWFLNLYIASSGASAIKKLEEYAAPFLLILSFAVIIWALSIADWNLNVLLSQPAVTGDGSNFWIMFFPALSAMIAFDGGIALSMPDFTRYCKNQKSQYIGQLAGAPIMTAFITFVGICGTSGSYIAFGEAIWEPAILVSKFSNPFIVVFFSVFIILATMTTNIAANLVPPSVVFSTFFSKKIDYKKAVLLAAVLALLSQPWKALSDANNLIYSVCAVLGALLGPISGLYIVSYWFEHKTNVSLVDIYRENGGKYSYSGGWNRGAIVIFLFSSLIIFAGRYIPVFKIIFDNSYVIGIFGTGFIYYIYLKIIKRDQFMNNTSDNL